MALAHFNVNSKTRIVADASPVGLGVVLIQLQGVEWRVIAYAWRGLTDVERRYSQVEREDLALVWAYEHFSMFIFGRNFELEYIIVFTEIKAFHLCGTVGSPLASLWPKVIYRPGRTNIADALSRLNCRVPCGDGEHCDHVRGAVENSTPCALTPTEIEKALAGGPEISLVKECLHTGDWSASNAPAYFHAKNELCAYGQLLLHGLRIVISQC